MKKLLLGLLVSNFAFGGVITPIVKRNNVQGNGGALGAAWTKRVSHIGVEATRLSTEGINNKMRNDVSFSHYGESFKAELLSIEEENETDLTAQLGWEFENTAIALSLNSDDRENNGHSIETAFGIKHSGNIYSGFGVRNNVDGKARSNAIYAGIGHYNNFDENKKSVKELYVLYDDGDYNEATSDETLDEIRVAGEWTEIINDYQFFFRFSYSSGDSEEDDYDYYTTILLAELERRITENFFVELSFVKIDSDIKYHSAPATTLKVNGVSVNARYLLAKKHQFIAAFSSSDGDFADAFIDGTTTSLSYQFLW